jgi:hypothetical protein
MLGFVSVSILIYIVTSLFVGTRLLILARRTRGFPEFIVGMGFLMVGGSGYPLSAISGYGVKTVGEVLFPAYVVGHVVTLLGIFCFVLFTWKSFRPEAGWARTLVVVTGIGLLTIGCGCIVTFAGSDPSLPSHLAAHGWNTAGYLFFSVPFAWSAVEAQQAFRASRRREAIGLADPVVTNRLMLWSLFAIVALVMVAGNLFAQLSGQPIFASSVALLATGVGSIVTSGALYLAFAPPARYLDFVRRAHSAAA